MGFLDNVKKASRADIPSNWIRLEASAKVDEAIESSNKKPIAFFKHSTRCGISVQVKTGLEEQYDLDTTDLDFYYLDLLEYRQISNYIAEKTGVIHQSPQLIVIKNGEVIYKDSHFSINYDKFSALV